MVIGPSSRRNSLGRVLFLADMLELIGPVQISARDDGQVWSGAADFDWPLTVNKSFDNLLELVSNALGEAERAGDTLVLVAVKPFARSLVWATRVRSRLGGRIRLVADVDDLDAEFSRELRQRRVSAGLMRILPTARHPARIERIMARYLPEADLLTVSSWALSEQLPPTDRPLLRVPHPRPPAPACSLPPAGPRLRLGFFGTPRPHKGFPVLLEILEAAPFVELHLLEGTALPKSAEATGARVLFHPHRGLDTLQSAFRGVDAVALPQDLRSKGASYQLPARLMDALRFGRAPLASPTPAITEIAGDSAVYLDFSRPIEQIADDLQDLHADHRRIERLGRQAHALYLRHYTPAVLAAELEKALLASS